MVLKRGSQWKHFWRTCTSPAIAPLYALRPTIGANTMMYPFNHPHLRPLPFLFSHILNTPMSTSLSRTKRYRTSFTFYSHAGDVRPNTTHKVPLFLYLGHHGDLSTPPSSPSTTFHRTLHSNRPTAPTHHVHCPLDANDPGPMDMSDSSV